jgi:hypothetical protein
MFAIALSVLLLATETAAATPAQATQAQTSAETKSEKKICKREQATESRLGSKRICLTAQQWRERQDAATRDLGDVSKQ